MVLRTRGLVEVLRIMGLVEVPRTMGLGDPEHREFRAGDSSIIALVSISSYF